MSSGGAQVPLAPVFADGTRTTASSSAGPETAPERVRSGLSAPSAPAATEDAEVILKRQRNTLAARKYRQKRLDRIRELEDALRNATQERDDLKLRLARQEAETAALREMMRSKSEKGP